MPLKTFKPYTQGRRQMSIEDFSDLTKKPPERSLLGTTTRKGGRNNTGEIMVRHQGGGHKRRYRMVDFLREKWGVPGRVAAIEYDPNRSARLALIFFADGEKRYIIRPEGLSVGTTISQGPNAEIKVGNALPLINMPLGTMIHNIELVPGKGAKLVRSAGGVAQLMSKEGGFVQVRMPSGEVRLFPDRCMATVGQVGNIDHGNVVLGNAGRARHMGIRPTVRGTAMNAVDHPHGGGRGKSKGHNHPVSPWNQPAKGYKTRRKKLHDWMIVSDRRKQKQLS